MSEHFYTNEKEAINALSTIAKDLSEEEFDELYEKLETLKDSEKYFIINVEGKKYKVATEHAYLEIERLKKNDTLKNSINKTVKVAGIVSNVKMHANTALFCLSPCEIDGVEIGHTWVRYSPDFKGIKYGSTVIFYSEIKKYGDFNNKSGVNWQEHSYIRMRGGNNAPLYNISLGIRDISFAKHYHAKPYENAYYSFNQDFSVDLSNITLKYKPQNRDFFSYKHLFFQDVYYDDNKSNIKDPLHFVYNTLDRELVVNSKYSIITDRETEEKLNCLLLFEWLSKLEDWEFWGYTQNH